MKTSTTLIVSFCALTASYAADLKLRRLPESTSPNGKREILVSDIWSPKKGIPIVVRERSPRKVIDRFHYRIESDESACVGCVRWNPRSNYFILEGAGFRFSFSKLYAVTNRGVVECEIPSIGSLKLDPTSKLETFLQEHAAEIGQPVGFPSGGADIVRWADATSFEYHKDSSQQYGQRRVGWSYTIIFQISERDLSVKPIKIEEKIGFLDRP